jgi:hypothetical protein
VLKGRRWGGGGAQWRAGSRRRACGGEKNPSQKQRHRTRGSQSETAGEEAGDGEKNPSRK